MQHHSGRGPLYKILGQHGQEWEIYEDGSVTGFPENVTVINYAKPLLDFLRNRVGLHAPQNLG